MVPTRRTSEEAAQPNNTRRGWRSGLGHDALSDRILLAHLGQLLEQGI